MAKKVVKPVSKSGSAVFQLPELDAKGFLFLREFKLQAIVVAVLAIAFYFNSRMNEYALDDDIVMRQNSYVQKGFSGIGDIMSNDAYKSFYQSMGVEQQLSGGRYRPLSIVSFAIEQQLFGDCYGERYEQVRDSLFQMQKTGISDIAGQTRLIGEKNQLELNIKESTMRLAPIRHYLQIAWFALSMVVLLGFLRKHVFRSNTDLAFLTTILFVIHPIHTEVIANIKSRDEIFSLLFIVLTMDYFFRYDLSKKTKELAYGLLFFFLALLSKEYAITLFALIPAGLMIFHKRKLKDLSTLVAPLLGMLVFYFFVRAVTVGFHSEPVSKKFQDPLNDPYLYANTQERILSKINRLDDYVWLLFVPYPLVADYSYQHFPYSTISDIGVWISLLVMAGLIWATFKLWKQRHPMSFALLFFFAFFMLINNILFDIGATMGERLIYHSSLGFCMLLAWGIVWAAEKLGENGKFAVTGITALLTVPAFLLTVERNAEWKNDYTLFTSDVIKHPNSALCNGNAGARYMDLGIKYLSGDSADSVKVNHYADISITYLQKSVELHKKYANGWLNLGLCYYNKKQYEKATDAWEKVYQIFPSNPILQSYAQMLVAMANEKAQKKDYAGAALFYSYAVRCYPADSKIWADYAGASYMSQNFAQAKIAFDQAMQHTTDQAVRANLQQGFNASYYNDSAHTKWSRDSMNPDNNVFYAKYLMGTPEFYPKAHALLDKALELRPENPIAKRMLDSLVGLEQKLIAPPTLK